MTKISFLNPPLVELVLGVQFKSNLISHDIIFKLYSELLNSDFPKIEERNLLPVIIEKLDQPNEQRIIGNFNTRKLFISESSDKLIQIQNDKFLFNWRKSDNLPDYPHFDSVFKDFKEIFNVISKKIDISKSINQFEITYVDHIEYSNFQNFNYNLSEVFSFIDVQECKSVNLNFVLPIPEINGNMHLKIQSAIRNTDNKPILVVESTCRGYNDNNYEDWFHSARKILVKYFDKMFNPEVKESWNPVTN